MDANSEIGGHEVTYPFFKPKKNTSFSSKQSWKREQKYYIYIYIHNKCMYIYIYIYYIYIIVNYSIIYIYRLYHIYIYTYILSFKNPFQLEASPVITFRSPSPITTTDHRTTGRQPQHRTAAGTPCSRFRLQHALRAAAFAETPQIHPQRCHHPGWWLVPQTHLKKYAHRQIGSYPQVRVKIKNSWVATT